MTTSGWRQQGTISVYCAEKHEDANKRFLSKQFPEQALGVMIPVTRKKSKTKYDNDFDQLKTISFLTLKL